MLDPTRVQLALALDRIAKLEKQLAETDIDLMRCRKKMHKERKQNAAFRRNVKGVKIS